MRKNRKLRVGGNDLKPNTSFQVSLDIARLPSRTPIEIPVFVSSGSTVGPVILLLAGLHGDEVNSVEIIRSLMEQGLNRPLKGTVICIPVLNIYGFISFSRDVTDGKDVNRSFPGTLNGSLASRIAYHLRKEILPVVDYVIDFHTGGASRSNYPQVRYHFEDMDSKTLADTFSAPFIVNSKPIPKSLRHLCTKMGIPIIIYEGGESLRHDKFAASVGIQGILRVMQSFEMIQAREYSVEAPILISRRRWIRARNSGMFHVEIGNGDAVVKGQVLGFITDPFADFKVKIKAPAEGMVIGVNNSPIVNRGDALVHLGFRS